MRQVLIAVIAYCILNLFIPKWWEAAMSSAPRWVIDAITFVAAVACLGFVVSAEPVYTCLKSPFNNPVSSTLIVACLVAAVAGAAWWIFIVPDQTSKIAAASPEPSASPASPPLPEPSRSSPAQSPNPDASIAIFIETAFIQLPIPIPPRSTINLVLLHKKAPAAGTWGYATISNDASQETQWPNQRILEKAITSENLTITAWRCEIRNRGKVDVQNVTIPIRYGFAPGKEWIHKVIVNPLTMGERFVFYVVNNSSSSAHGFWPETISCRVLGEKAFRQTALQRPYKNPIEQIMMFGASMAPLSGGWE